MNGATTMAKIDAKHIVKNQFPTDEGARLANELLKTQPQFDDVVVDLSSLPASLIISAFFNAFLQRVHDNKPDALSKARKIRWETKFPFQQENIQRWMKDFKPASAEAHA